MVNIRNEREEDYKLVEEITRKAFYNVYVPGCVEHYLVHIMRNHKDFVKELDFVIEVDGKVIGNIMYTKAKLVDEKNNEKEILTFGPISILPEYQRKGYGKKLMEYSFKKAKEMGYDFIVIYGAPSNYVSSGFKSSKKYNILFKNKIYPSAMLAKELKENVLDGRKWSYIESEVMKFDEEKAEEFDKLFEKMEKKYMPSQEVFYIMSNSKMV